ncbi:MAG: hypothetical protein D6832_04040 [Alphaproteobacteria bacterium]|nr:MAG: hypothetical protein D6832_04040 [Alphaproteobacteria bacterium]
MIAFLRLVVVLFVLSTLAHVVLAALIRARLRRRLGRAFDEGAGREAGIDDRDDYIRRGLAAWDRSPLRRALVLAIYLLPPLLVGAVMAVINAQ